MLAPIPAYKTMQPRYTSSSITDVIVFAIFFGGVVVCFALSAMWVYTRFAPVRLLMTGSFHILLNHSERLHNFGLQLDYVSRSYKDPDYN
jgi:hypothetical protein